MSTVSSLAPQGAAAATANTVDNQIKALEKRIGEGIKNGTITAQQGKDLTKALDEVQKTIDSGASGAGLSGADMRQISQALRKIGQTLTAAAQGSQGSSASAGMDSDGDYDNSGVGTPG